MKTILILAANPKNTSPLRLDEEVREINDGLQRSKHRNSFIIKQKWAVRLRDIRRALLDDEPQIIHFCGHGEETGILVENENGSSVLLNPIALDGLFELFSGKIECVLFNSCYSEIQANAIISHIPYVIGMRKAIDDKAAIEFSVGFYDALGAGKSIEDAYKFGCNAIQLFNLPESNTPILKTKNCINDYFTNKRIYHNLPQPDYGKFIGREAEISKIYKILEPYPNSQHSIVTIDGIGGIGKTALALEIAIHYLLNYESIEIEHRFEAVIWTSAKSTVLTAEEIAPRRQIMRTLNDIYNAISVTLQRDDITQDISSSKKDELIRNALTRQRTLLIIDNLETVDDEAVINFLRELPAPTKAIVTTRHRLDVAYPIRLAGMPWEDAKGLIEQECEKKAVVLNADDSKRLYKRTGGVPLAIVWSIAQMGFGYKADSVLNRLGEPSSNISRFCFDGIIDRVKSKPAYKALLVISLCADSVSRETIGYVANLSEFDRDDGLVDLEKLSLVNKSSDRFSLLPLTKQFANYEFSKSDSRQTLRERWINYFEERSKNYTSLHWNWTNYDWLLSEGNNILSIIDWAVTTSHGEIALSFARAALRFLDIKGHYSDLFDYGKKLKMIASDIDDKRTGAWICIHWLSWFSSEHGNYNKGKQFVEEGYSFYKSINDTKGIIHAKNHIGRVFRQGQKFEEARISFEEAMEMAVNNQYGDGIAAVNFQLGKLEGNIGNWINSKQHWEKVIDWCENHEDEADLDISFHMGAIGNLGWVEYNLGNFQGAKEMIEKSLRFFEKTGGRINTTTLYYRLSEIEMNLGNFMRAEQYAKKCLFWANRLNIEKLTESVNKILLKIDSKKVE